MPLDDRFTTRGLVAGLGLGFMFGAVFTVAYDNPAFAGVGLLFGIVFALALSKEERDRDANNRGDGEE